ncbi:MAG TPA: hypothetical protein PLZ45_14335 [Ferruginibacter sp.]|nr:exonuclease [Chitinophagaceae bacterium]HRI25852.1 hypothetical protein [Ferruginibacter sp.]
MKITTWNCNMAFRKKASVILEHHPDILIVPECEHPDKLIFSDDIPAPADMCWFGENRNKGLGIFSYSPFRFKLQRNYNKELKTVIPLTVTGGGFDFTLFAIWANNPGDADGQYVEQVWKAIHYYNRRIKSNQTMLIGDFNSNSIWDRKYRVGNHSHVVNKLDRKGIKSCYHLHYNQEQGKEAHPTFYLYKHQDKPYHLDYCFASSDLARSIQSVEIGDHASWSRYSDHMPVMITFAFPGAGS